MQLECRCPALTPPISSYPHHGCPGTLDGWWFTNEHQSLYPIATTSNTDIQSLTTSMDVVEGATLEAVLESVIAIPALVRVRLFAQLLLLCQLERRTGNTHS